MWDGHLPNFAQFTSFYRIYTNVHASADKKYAF